MLPKHALIVLSFFFALLHGAEAQATVKFNQDITPATATMGVFYSLDLNTLVDLSGQSGAVTWSASADMPAWINLDSANHKMSGTPGAGDIGLHSFRLTAKDNEQGAITRIDMTVIAPPQWKADNIDLGLQNERVLFTFDLNTVVTDPAGGKMTFTATGLKPWMKLTSDGILSGTPQRSDVGKYDGITFTATSAGGKSSATAFGEVQKVIQPSKWVSNTISLQDAFEDQAYSRNINEFVLSPEPNVSLKFEVVSAPSWVQVSSSGNIFGTPHKPDLGTASVTVLFRATIDGTEYPPETTTFSFKVNHVNHAPTWASDPITLPSAYTKVAYNQDLSNSASDVDDNDKLTFKLVSGPAWAKLSSTGVLTGTPDKASVGANTLTVSVTDLAGASAQTHVQITVIKSNEPPTWNKKPTVLPNAKEDASMVVDLTGYATDPDGDAMTFTLLSGPAWLSLTSSGILTGTPKAGDVGLNKISVQVTDNKSGSDVTDILINVDHVNHPPQWILDPVRITVKEEQPLNMSIAPYAKDPDKGDTLTFQVLEGPSWLTMTPDGTISGTPQIANEGENKYVVRVTDQAGATATGNVIIQVDHVNHKPIWAQNPIALSPNAKEKTAYTNSVASFASDPDKNDTLTFSKVSGPSWITVNADGSISGTPARSDVGTNSFQVRVSDPSNESAVTTVTVVVDRVNTPPRWRQDPILLTDAYEDKAYKFDLTPYAVDDENDKLTFKKVTGPAWLTVSADGQITGTPKKGDIGEFSAVLEVSDGQYTAQAGAKGKVVHTNHPPVIAADMPSFIIKERQVFKTSLTQYVTDADGDKLNFILTDSADWATLFSSGDLVLKPVRKDIGTYALKFRVDDGTIPVMGVMNITVVKDPRPPVWLQDPTKFQAKTNEGFTGSLAGAASDLDGEKVTFSKKSGPDWLVVAANGDLSGTPRDADLGDDAFLVTACNEENLCTAGNVVITVKPGIQVDTTKIDTAVPGAPTENLWIVDNAKTCDKVIRSLKNNINVYYDELAKAGIHHTGIYLSSDAGKWDGLPIRSDDQSLLLRWDEANVAQDFVSRMDRSIADRCNHCLSSPIWSMFRFYERVPGLNEIYHKGYFEPKVPMDAVIITQQLDHYKAFAKNTAQKNWAPTDYAKNFIDVHNAEQKPYRIHTIAPECPSLFSEEASQAGPENSYRVLTSKTNGQYYTVENCNVDLKPMLKDFAQRVIFRAYVHAKERVKLTKVPKDTSTIKLTIGGVVIPNNAWEYDAGNNELVIHWYLIDQGQLKAGDTISIEYRVS